jgi:hypothetical protein
MRMLRVEQRSVGKRAWYTRFHTQYGWDVARIRKWSREHDNVDVNTTLAHYIKDVPEVTANGMAQVEELFSELDAANQIVQ